MQKQLQNIKNKKKFSNTTSGKNTILAIISYNSKNWKNNKKIFWKEIERERVSVIKKN